MRYLILAGLLAMASGVYSQIVFDEYFNDQTLRIDYFHTGNSTVEEIITDKMYVQGTWAGSKAGCIQPFELGTYKVLVRDSETFNIIYTKGYNSIFAEYQTIGDAIKGIKRTFHESVLIPLPKRRFILEIEKRDRQNSLYGIFKQEIDPLDYHIIREKPGSQHDVVISTVKSGDPHNKVDIVILGEGYQENEADKFKIDLENYTKIFFTVEPYKSRRNQFNIHGVFSPSVESGTDEPRQQIYKNTRLSSSFNYFDLDRYCLVDDNKSIRDVASKVPYDVIVIMVNRERYGGGGIYNCQSVFTARAPNSNYVLLHEFGHGFAGLADEYFSSSITYVDFYTEGTEPLEANVTAQTERDKIKWKQFLSPGIQIPTDWGKARYDSLLDIRNHIMLEGEKKLSALRKSSASEARLMEAREEISRQVVSLNREIHDFYEKHPLKDKVGLFEGANYMSKGLYRPTLMSLMNGIQDELSYLIVNEHAILEVMNYYTGEK